MKNSLAFPVLVASLSVVFSTARAQWQGPGVPLSLAANDQFISVIASDGAGGAIVAWQDGRGANYDIYARRVDASGAPQWTADGIAVCTAASDQWEPKIVSDGAGGAIITWYDNRAGSASDIYAQRINAAGVPQWTANGVALCTATDEQIVPVITSDGAGGAIITWYDRRPGTHYDVYAQRVNAAGAVQWTANGVALCTAVSNQTNPMIDSDGAGGAIVAWEDTRTGNSDIYAQRVNGSGVVQWAANGVGLCTLASGQITPVMVADGANGAIVTWRDGRNGAGTDIFVQRVSGTGAALWTTDGVAVCTAANFQLSTTIISDGANGAIITWQDLRNGTHYDIYAHHVNSVGVPQWAANGVAICNAAGDQSFPTLVFDGAGGAVMAWNDFRDNTLLDLYAQRVSSAGSVQWAANGMLVTTVASDKLYQGILADGPGGAILAWADFRNGASDIYVQKLNASGGVPTAVSGPTRSVSLTVSAVYPNPFARSAFFDIQLTTESVVQVDIFDVAGRRVRAMTMPGAGSHRVEFDGRDDDGRLLTSGVYFYRVKAAGETVTRKMVITR